jgi:hypothetical protein
MPCSNRALILIKFPCRFLLSRDTINRPELSSGNGELAVVLEPRDDFRPYARMRLPPDQDTKMLQTSNFAWIFDDLRVLYRHSVKARLNRCQRGFRRRYLRLLVGRRPLDDGRTGRSPQESVRID